MVAPISQSLASSTYALRALTDIASHFKAGAPNSKTLPDSVLSRGLDPMRDAAANITRILLDAQIGTLAQAPVIVSDANYTHPLFGLTEMGATVLIDAEDGKGPQLKRVSFGATSLEKNVVLLKDAKGTTSITTNGPTGSLTTQTGTLTGREREDLNALTVGLYNDRSITITWAANHDIGRVQGGTEDELFAIATSGNVARVSGGDGDDTIAILGGGDKWRYAAGDPRVERIDGGNGDDIVQINASDIDHVTGGVGYDQFMIRSTGTLSRLDGGDGDDSIHVTAAREVRDLSGGIGDDYIAIYQAGAVRNLAGGDGDDSISMQAATIENVSGGGGDDTISIWNTTGNVSTINLREGDGNDLIVTNGPLEIRRLNADGTQQDLSSAAISKNEDGSITIRFADSDDSVTVRENYINEAYVVQVTDEGALLFRPKASSRDGI